MTNRLAAALSPYLQQHADNPVEWWEWGPDAFAEAKRRDVPVLLSIGYAACHWCHVMAHESFEDVVTAADMNANFVNVKVDREERPDVDEAFMATTVGLTGRGGWPMTVFCTPDGKPFYAGTYYPPRPMQGMPSFRQVLDAISRTWREQRGEVEEAGTRIRHALTEQGVRASMRDVDDEPVRLPTDDDLAAAVRALASAEDRRHGGFGTSMKFPQSPVLAFLLRHAARRTLLAGGPQLLAADDSGAIALGVLSRTLHAMARSGMYDQVAGGFARFAVDRAWVVPHFEKMLDDNAQLARVYLGWFKLTGDPLGARIAEQTCEWLLAELRTAEGGFASSLDADTPVEGPGGRVHGVEGFTYVWTPGELVDVLGAEDGAWVAQLCGVTEDGTFEHGTSTLQLLRPIDGQLDSSGGVDDAQRWAVLRARLAVARAQRPQPARDDKVITGWNGLVIAALAEVGAVRARPDFVDAAATCADLLVSRHLDDGGLLCRASRDGAAGSAPGVLADHAQLAEGLLALHAVTGEAEWLDLAGVVLEAVLGRFSLRVSSGHFRGFSETGDQATWALLSAGYRPLDPTDGAQPAGWTSAMGAMQSYAALTGSADHREAAEAGLWQLSAVGSRAPEGFGWGLAVAEAWLDGPREVAVAGEDPAQLHRIALLGTAPGMVVSAGAPDAEGVPLLADRTPGAAGEPRAFVCRGFVCDAPTASPTELARLVGAWTVATSPPGPTPLR